MGGRVDPGPAPGPTPTSARRSALAVLWVPCLVLVIATWPCIGFQLPATADTVTESYEPLKTLKFFHSLGRDVHKWGPMTNFVYAPVFGTLYGWWALTGEAHHVSSDYPYGLQRPHESIGAMILAGRLLVLAAGVGATAVLGWSLYRATSRPWLTMVTMSVYAASAPQTIIAMGNTKPDGLMLAFATAALAVYVRIITEGLTRRRGVTLAVLAVCSLSCKELTPLMFVLPCAGIALDSWLRTAHDPQLARRQRGDLLVTLGSGIAAYLLINVVYAPAAWLERMRLVFGPLKDPAIWASPDQTPMSYLVDGLWSTFTSLGYLGTALLVLAVVAAVSCRQPRAWLAWLPPVSHVLLVLLTAGYMADYFMLPLPVALSVPVTLAGSAALCRLLARPRPRLVLLGRCAAIVVVLLTAWTGLSYCRLRLAAVPDAMVERYVTAHLPPAETTYPATLWPRNHGSSRLSWLGYTVDDRALYQLIDAPQGSRPRWLLIDQELRDWLADFKRRPARARNFEGTGFDYRGFDGVEALGYKLTLAIHPELPTACPRWLIPDADRWLQTTLLVYEDARS